ncbi:hypothetical protein D081_1523 [Anaerovibrio sp. JC8]|uniref:hypothetical protein n=1 Tax=Anaerovibrio sp. JC8 TaxID=1240085 RepID=UPI000A0EB245|nr:hypothetical protein [Anaerovibrio sp. JC8]ORT99942.1 hypothetical protein D081_1523 [Anaerovibrio sp. JC8]
MWSPIAFKLYLKQIKDRKEFIGQPVNFYTEIFKIIADELYLSEETVKSWTRDNNNGPGDNDTKARLTSLLGVDLNHFEKNEGNIMNTTVNSNNYNNAVDLKIADCIKEVYAFTGVLLANDKQQGIPKVLSNGYTDIIDDYCKRLVDLSNLLPDDLSAEVQCYVSEDELSRLKDINSAWNNPENVFESIYETLGGDIGEGYDYDEISSLVMDPLGNSRPDVEFDGNRVLSLIEKNKIFYPFLRDMLYNPKIDELDYQQFNDCEDEEIENMGSLITDVKLFKDYSTFIAANLIIGYVVKTVSIIEKMRKQLLAERQEVSKETINARMATLIGESGIVKYSLEWGPNSPLAEFLKKGNN